MIISYKILSKVFFKLLKKFENSTLFLSPYLHLLPYHPKWINVYPELFHKNALKNIFEKKTNKSFTDIFKKFIKDYSEYKEFFLNKNNLKNYKKDALIIDNFLNHKHLSQNNYTKSLDKILKKKKISFNKIYINCTEIPTYKLKNKTNVLSTKENYFYETLIIIKILLEKIK